MSGIKDLNHMNQAELAQLWECSTRTIQRLPELPTLRHGSGMDGFYVWSECRAFEKRNKTPAEGRLSHDERLKKVKADSAELDLALKQKTLVQESDVRSVWGSECAAMRARLLSIPATAALKIDPSHTQAQREEILRREIYEALEALSGGEE